jgi:hypothetical protein
MVKNLAVVAMTEYKSVAEGNGQTQSLKPESMEALENTVLLDIDQTSMYGNDCNDVITCLQIDDMNDVIPQVISLLVNPAMVKAVKTIEQKLGHVRIVLYSARYNLLQDMGPGTVFNVGGEDLYFPKHTQMKDLPLFDSKIKYNKFKRLFLARDAICQYLGKDSIEMVITSRPGKCVVRTCGLISPPANPENAYLFDDRIDLAGQYHVITIPVYNAVTETCKESIYALVGSKPLSDKAVTFAWTAEKEHGCLGEANRICVNTVDAPPKEWCLSFMDSIERMIFQYACVWMGDNTEESDMCLDTAFDPWNITVATAQMADVDISY